MFEVSGLQIAVIALACFSLFAVGKWLFNKDEKVEARRKNSIDIAAELRAAGLEFAYEFFRCYAVGDYSGMLEEARVILFKLKDPEQRRLALAKLFQKQLETRLKDPVELGKIKAALAAAEPPKPAALPGPVNATPPAAVAV